MCDEHRFTSTCEAFLSKIEATSTLGDVKSRPRILLINAIGNVHDLGLRFVRLLMKWGRSLLFRNFEV